MPSAPWKSSKRRVPRQAWRTSRRFQWSPSTFALGAIVHAKQRWRSASWPECRGQLHDGTHGTYGEFHEETNWTGPELRRNRWSDSARRARHRQWDRRKGAMKAGEVAPDFEVVANDGAPVRLSELLESGPVVLFFFPAAFSPGCTVEACHFRDLEHEFRAVGAQVVGISTDQPHRQAQFGRTYAVRFKLLSDPRSSVARAFGVARMGFLPNQRTTFVIDTDRTVRAVITNEVNMNVHADRALRALSPS